MCCTRQHHAQVVRRWVYISWAFLKTDSLLKDLLHTCHRIWVQTSELSVIVPPAATIVSAQGFPSCQCSTPIATSELEQYWKFNYTHMTGISPSAPGGFKTVPRIHQCTLLSKDFIYNVPSNMHGQGEMMAFILERRLRWNWTSACMHV